MALGRDKADNKTEAPEREITGFSRTLDILGDAPILLILESYWLGTRRFDAFVRQTGLIKTVVSDRLARLVDQGFMQKVRYSERPERFEYRGCDKLNDLFPVALCMLHWEKAWGRKSDVTHVRLTHVNCGEESDPYPVCCVCDEDVQARDVVFNISASDLHGSYARRRRQTRATDARMGPTTLMDDIIRIMGDRWSALILLSVQNQR